MKRKLTLFATLIMSMSGSMFASDWIGEPMNYGNPYYLLDATRSIDNAFLSSAEYNGSIYPSYSNYAGANLFSATQGSKVSGNYCMILQNMTLANAGNSASYLYTDGEGLKAYSSKSRDFEKEFEGDNDFKFNIWYHVIGSYYNLSGAQEENSSLTLATFVKYTSSSKIPKQWKFISPEQYIGRPKLDAIVQKVETEYGTVVENMPEGIRDAYNAAKSAQTLAPGVGSSNVGVLGPQIINSYSSLTNAYNVAAYDSAYSDAYGQLASLINMTEMITTSLNAAGNPNTALNDALATAKTALANNSTPENTEEAIAAAISNLNSAKTALSGVAGPSAGSVYVYCRDMKNLALELGYSIPTEQQAALMAIIAGIDQTTDATALIQQVQSDFKTWVNKQIEGGAGFPAGSDFTAFILNNSFEMGDMTGWSSTTALNMNTSVTTSGSSYVFKSEKKALSSSNITLSQTISSLPAGTYELTATTNGTMTVTVGSETYEVEDGKVTFTIPNGGAVATIKVSGTEFTADEFKLVLKEGAATTVQTQEITISAFKYASCISAYNLDFSTREDIKAYGVVPDMKNSKVNLIPLSKVIKGTAFIVYGEAGTYTVNAGINATELTSEQNQYIYRNAEVNYSGEFADYWLYYLGKKGTNEAVFKRLSTAEGSYIGANKGFFAIAKTNNPSTEFRVAFQESTEGEETAIDPIQTERQVSASIFTLSGQKVNAISKNGLYIVNGKKVLMNK